MSILLTGKLPIVASLKIIKQLIREAQQESENLKLAKDQGLALSPLMA